MQTSIDIAAPILEELKRIRPTTGGKLGELVNTSRAYGLKSRRPEASAKGLAWTSQPMRARVDLEDTKAFYALLNDDGS